MFQKCLYGSRDIEIDKTFYFFNVFWNLCVLSNFFGNLCVFPLSYTCKHVISYKCKYAWFHLNMLFGYFKRLTKEQTC